MILTRRRFFMGLGGAAALVAAPAIVRASSLMPVSVPKLIIPPAPSLSFANFLYDDAGLLREVRAITGIEALALTEDVDSTAGISIWRGGLMPSVGFA